MMTVIIETDYMILVNFIKGDTKVLWPLREKITQLLTRGGFHTKFCYREDNCVADALANIGVKEKQEIFFTEVISLPRQSKAILKNDQDLHTNFRIRTKKDQFNIDHG